jgi:hypothetical protein
MTFPANANRRTVLKTAGGLAVGATVLAGAGSAGDGPAGLLARSDEDDEDDEEDDGSDGDEATEPGGLPAVIDAHGHYAWFPFGPASWSRSPDPYDIEEDDSRWLAEPTDEGGVRVLVENLGTDPPNRNAGFDVHLGPIGDVAAVTVDARTLRTPTATGPATLFLGLYLDADDDGEFFAWESTDGVERFTGLGDDEEGIAFVGASGSIEMDRGTGFDPVGAGSRATLAALQRGGVDGITGETAAALYVGVVNGGEGVDEVVIDDLTVVRS